MSDKLITWLNQELKQRDWSYSALARKAGVSRPLVSRTLSGDMPPSADFCIKVAIALDIPPETLLRMAGILPPAAPVIPADNVTLQQLVELARTLSPEKQQQLLEYVTFLSSRD